MKSKNRVFVILIFALICFAGCAVTKAVPYSFAENESENGTASIIFASSGKRGVDLHFFESAELPIPEGRITAFGRAGEYWSPVIFPAGRPFQLTVNVWSSQTEAGKVHTFNCPALTAGSSYTLEIQSITVVFTLSETLVLKDAKTRAIVYQQRL